MSFDRQNILSLIGKDRRKYSTCIITCFNFDFTFFEERIMSILRTADIKNVNVFVDGKYLENAQENSSNREFQTHKTYSFNPIYTAGVFHPKIMLLMGAKHGLLIIGSGNISSSGLSTNDEIWGAFHMNGLDSPNAPLIADAWHYLQQFIEKAKGFNLEKFKWIPQRSPWVADLASLRNQSFIDTVENQSMKFLANDSTGSSYTKLLNNLPDEEIKKLTIVAPYFDKNGTLLKNLNIDLNVNNIECITDETFGLLPSSLDYSLNGKVKFFDWKNCAEKYDSAHNRLHAKLFHFEYKSGQEYLLIGSANGSIQAFGNKDQIAANEEAGILLRRNEGKNYLNEFKISTDGVKEIELSTINRNESNNLDNTDKPNIELRIIHSEISGNELTIYIDKKATDPIAVQIIDLNGLESEVHETKLNDDKLSIILNNPEKAYKVYLLKKDQRISNFSLIHQVAAQIKCNPDPSQIELNQLIEQMVDDPNGDHFIKLLKHRDMNWVDEVTNEIGVKTSRRPERRTTESNTSEEEKSFDPRSEEDLNKLTAVKSSETTLLNNSNVQIADILKIISGSRMVNSKSFEESEEEALLLNKDSDDGGGKEVIENKKYRVNGEEELYAIQKFLENVYEKLNHRLKHFFDERSIISTSTEAIQLNDLSLISASLDLLYLFIGKKYELTKTEIGIIHEKKANKELGAFEKRYHLERLNKRDKNHPDAVFYLVLKEWLQELKEEILEDTNLILLEETEYTAHHFEEDYFKEGVLNSGELTELKSYLINLFGKFLLTCNCKAGYKEYEYQLIQAKILEYRKSIFERALFLMLNLHWREQEMIYFKLMLLDMLRTIYPKELDPNVNNDLTKSLEEQKLNSTILGETYQDNLEYFIGNVLPKFIAFKGKLQHDKQNIIKEINAIHIGTILYSSRIGFYRMVGKGEDYLLIQKHGLPWEESQKQCYLKLAYKSKKAVAFD